MPSFYTPKSALKQCLFPFYALELIERIAEISKVSVRSEPIGLPYLFNEWLDEIECSETDKDDKRPVSEAEQCSIALRLSDLPDDSMILIDFFFDSTKALIEFLIHVYSITNYVLPARIERTFIA
jgi:hypothetical protein